MRYMIARAKNAPYITGASSSGSVDLFLKQNAIIRHTKRTDKPNVSARSDLIWRELNTLCIGAP